MKGSGSKFFLYERKETMEYLDVADLKKLLHKKQITLAQFLKWSLEAGRRVEQGSDEEVEFMGGRSTTTHTFVQRIGAANPKARTHSPSSASGVPTRARCPPSPMCSAPSLRMRPTRSRQSASSPSSTIHLKLTRTQHSRTTSSYRYSFSSTTDRVRMHRGA